MDILHIKDIRNLCNTYYFTSQRFIHLFKCKCVALESGFQAEICKHGNAYQTKLSVLVSLIRSVVALSFQANICKRIAFMLIAGTKILLFTGCFEYNLKSINEIKPYN